MAKKLLNGKTKSCTNGYSCGASCIARAKNCLNPLEGQGKNYADWLEKNQDGEKKKPSLSLVDNSSKNDSESIGKELSALYAEATRIVVNDEGGSQSKQGLTVLSQLREAFADNPERFRGLRDGNGNLQAAAIVSSRKTSLYVDFLASSPWNLSAVDDERKTRGAGTRMIVEIIRESARRGKGGQITLEALGDAANFYSRLGFTSRGERYGSTRMSLSTQAARDLLSKLGEEVDFKEEKTSNADEGVNGFVKELEDLELEFGFLVSSTPREEDSSEDAEEEISPGE